MATRYQIEELIPFPGFNYSGAYDINSKGECVGESSGMGHIYSIACVWDSASLAAQNLNLPGVSSHVTAIADDGTIVGYYRATTFDNQAFIILPGAGPELLEPLTADVNTGGTLALGFGVSPVGICPGSRNERLACSWDITTKKATALGKLSQSDRGSVAFAGNKKGQIVGCSIDAHGNDQAFLWTPGEVNGVPGNPQMQNLGTLGGNSARALGINNQGQVVGESQNAAGATHAFLWTKGGTGGSAANPQMEDLGTVPGHFSSAATYINSRGEVFGWSMPSNGPVMAFISSFSAVQWKPGPLGIPVPVFSPPVRVMTDLNLLIDQNSGWVLRNVTRGNDHGEIVGWGEKNGKVRGYKLKPQTTGTGQAVVSMAVALLTPGIAAGAGGWTIDLVTGRIIPVPPPQPYLTLSEEARKQIFNVIKKDLTSGAKSKEYSAQIKEFLAALTKHIQNKGE